MVIFSPDECEYIRSFYFAEKEHNSEEVQDYGKVQIKFSNSSVKYIISTNEELITFLTKKLKSSGVKSIPSVKFMRYEAGDNLARHADFAKYGVNTIYKTYLVQLSKPDDYVGGDFILGDAIQSREQGSLFIINPTVPHEVTKVISGERMSLVLFLREENLDMVKSLI
jgi:predicted 2-oxoglutarate/Fe(II)-dependent dioxygenase YbiX